MLPRGANQKHITSKYKMCTLDMDENDTNVLHFKKICVDTMNFHLRLEARKVNLFSEFFNKIEVVASHTRWTIHSPKQILSGINAFWKQCVVHRQNQSSLTVNSLSKLQIFYTGMDLLIKRRHFAQNFENLTCIQSTNSIGEAERLCGWRVSVDIFKYPLLGIDAKGNVFLLISIDVFSRSVSLQNGIPRSC